MKKVIVTGGAGYLGSHACKALKLAGFNPVTIDNLSTGHEKLVKWGSLEVGDVRDTSFLNKVFKKHKPIAIMHFAAKSLVGESFNNPEIYYNNNVGGTLSILYAMKENDVKNIVFSSSCAVYGEPLRKKIKESDPKNPINPYGSTKLASERMIEEFGRANGVNYSLLRYFNASGADPDLETGELHEPETHAIPLLIFAALDKKKKFNVFGTDYKTKDGTAIRDYIHVSDLADGHVSSLKLLLNKKQSHAVNLGTGSGTSVKELIDAVSKVTKTKINVAYGKRREGDAETLLADNSLAKKLLGFQCKKSKIEFIVKTALNWHKKN